MPQIIIKKIIHRNTDKQGNKLVSQKGKPYEKCSILTEGKRGEVWISGFGNLVTKSWYEGDVVDVVLEQKGEYWNFSLPEGATPIRKMGTCNCEDRVKALETKMEFVIAKLEAKEAPSTVEEYAEVFGGKVVEKEEIKLEDIPF